MVFLTKAAAEDLHDDVRIQAADNATAGYHDDSRSLYEAAWKLEALIAKATVAGDDNVPLTDELADLARDYGFCG